MNRYIVSFKWRYIKSEIWNHSSIVDCGKNKKEVVARFRDKMVKGLQDRKFKDIKAVFIKSI